MGAGPEKIVSICMERSLEVMIAIWGVLKTGAAYTSIDPAYPADRRAMMLDDISQILRGLPPCRMQRADPDLAARMRSR